MKTKINIEKLIVANNNTKKVSFYNTISSPITSELPERNVEKNGKNITIYGSQKNINLSFLATGNVFSANAKPVKTTFYSSLLKTTLTHEEETMSIKFPVQKTINASLTGDLFMIHSDSINAYNDSLLVKSLDNGVGYSITFKQERTNYAFEIECELIGLQLAKVDNMVVAKRGDLILFKFDNFYLRTNDEMISKTIDIDIRGGRFFIIPDSEFITSYLYKNVSLNFSFTKVMEPIISLSFYKDGMHAEPVNDEYLFGYRSRREFNARARINADKIASELIVSNGETFKTSFTLHFNKTKAVNYYEGFRVYDGVNLIKSQNFDPDKESITIDISKQILAAIEAKKQGRKAQDIVLDLKYSCTPIATSGDAYLGEQLSDNYVKIYGVYSFLKDKRPYITSKFTSIGETKTGTPFIENELGRSGNSKINIFEMSLQHGFPLGSISAKTFRIPLNMFYDSRLLTQSLIRPTMIGLPKGWMFNLSQCLIKNRITLNKTKGTKEVLYIDGENNTHVLTEKWYFKNEKGEEVLVPKEEVFLSNDQKLKFKDNDGVIHDITYQVDNDSGITFVSFNSKLNYAKQSDMELTYDFKISSYDKLTKLDVKKTDNDKVLVTFYRNDVATNSKPASVIFPEYPVNQISGFKATKILSIKQVYFENGKVYEFGQEAITPLDPVEIECELLFKDGKYFVNGVDTLYEADIRSDNKTKKIVFADVNDKQITLENNANVKITEKTDIPDYYENENIMEVNSQIKQCEDYIKELENQCLLYSSSITSLKGELSNQKHLKNLLDESNAAGEEAENIKNDNSGSDVDENYLSYLNQQKEFSTKYQNDSFKFQIENINRQINEQNASLQKMYSKINNYLTQLKNLKELKELYVKEQREDINDFVYDKQGNVLGFDYFGKLIYMMDRYKNEINIIYVNNKLVEIVSEKQKIVLHYDKENRLDYAVDSTGKKTLFSYLDKKFIMKKTDEKGELESTTFTYDEQNRIIDINNSMGQGTQFSWNEFELTSIVNKSNIESISVDGIIKGSNKTLSTSLLENVNDCIKITNVEAKTTESYHLDYEGKLINYSYQDNDDSNKNEVFLNCYQKDKIVLNLSYKERNILGSLNLNYGTTTAIIKTIKFDENGIDISKFSNREMLALSLDFSSLADGQLNNNTATFTVKNGNYNKTFVYDRIPKGSLSVPVLVKNKNNTIEISVAFSKPLSVDTISKLKIYRANAVINEYDEDDHLITSISNNEDSQFTNFNEDKATTSITTNKYGVIKTSRSLFDAHGRPIYEEDGDGNCKETYYDEKGQVVETREYNKSNSSLAKVSRTIYDDEGNATEFNGLLRDKNGNYPQEKLTYIPGTDIVSSIKHPNGQVMAYGYEFNTGLLTEIASDAGGQNNATQYGYVANRLVSISHHGIKFTYTLDNKGRKISTKLNGVELANNQYVDNFTNEKTTNGQKIITTFANGFETITITDKDGDLISTTTNDEDSIIYEYDNKDRLIKLNKNSGEETVVTTYNIDDQIISNEYKYGDVLTKEVVTYDDHGRIATKTETAGDIDTTTSFDYVDDKDSQIKEVSIGTTKQQFEYDALGRVIRKELLNGNSSLIDESIEYLRYGENSLNLVKEHDVRIGGVISDTTEYDYDVSGNITSIKKDEHETRYQYDELGRLIREDNPTLDKTIVYKYDAGGNILLKKEYGYSLEETLYSPSITTYTYASKGNKDQLINFNGQAIAYDVMGRPTSIGSHELTWSKKGKLLKFDDITYTYGLNGIRTSKTINGVKTTYFILNNKILAEKSNTKEIIYRYSLNKLIGFSFNNVEYIYERNIQGDILRIYRKDNLALVAEYQYDAYGNHNVINHNDANIGDVNPFRYRGYYFDSETGYYYLNTRYYSPIMGRFISPDELSILDETKSQINGLNLYMYCGNNPVMNIDPSGRNWWSDFWSGVGGIVVGVIVSLAEVAAGAALIITGVGAGIGAGLISTGLGSIIGGTINVIHGGSFIAGWTGGQVSGLIATAFSIIPVAGNILGTAIGSLLGSAANSYIDKSFGLNALSDKEIWLNAGISMGFNLILSGIFAMRGCYKIPNLNEGFIRKTTSLFELFIEMGYAALNGILPGVIESLLFNHVLKPKLSYN